MSIFDELNSEIVNAGTVRYDSNTGYIQYTTDGGTTWINLINTGSAVQILPALSSNTSSSFGTAGGSIPSDYGSNQYRIIDSSNVNYEIKLTSVNQNVSFTFTSLTFVKSISVYARREAGQQADDTFTLDYTVDGTNWIIGDNKVTNNYNYYQYSQVINTAVKAIRVRKAGAYAMYVKQFNAYN